eukprot:g3206.t1
MRLRQVKSLIQVFVLPPFCSLIRHFGHTLLDVSPRNITKLKIAVENDDSEEIAKITGRQAQVDNTRSNEIESTIVEFSPESFFEIVANEFKNEWVEYILNMIVKKSIPFCTGAEMMKNNFEKLWIDYKNLMEPMLKKDVMGWDICTIQVPLEMFTDESNIGSRVGTCNSIITWIHASREGTTFEHWKQLNKSRIEKVLKRSRGRMVHARVRIYCIKDICKVGIRGIIRFFLMHNVPSSTFKTPLMKWIIVFKWDRIFKKRAIKTLALFLVFLVLFNLFVLEYSIRWFNLSVYFGRKVYAIVIFVLMIVYTSLMFCYKLFQLKRYIQDGRIIFPSSVLKGMKYHLGFHQNLIDLTLNVCLLVFFTHLLFQMFDISKSWSYETFFSFLAFQVLLVWAKALYLAQAFKSTGIFVLMIRRVIRECLPYFLLLFGIMVGFGLTMYLTTLAFAGGQGWHCKFFNAGFEECQKMKENFGDPLKSILTMMYAMLGLFDPEVLFRLNDMSIIMIVVFVLYLILQTIVMFNMLVAAMGDAFDGVRAAEEESFVMARAQIIDQYEASLSNKQIGSIEGKIGKYLYVIMPQDKQLEKSVPFWKGRMTNIKDDVKNIVSDSQTILMQKMDQQTQNISQLAQDVSQLTQNMYDMFKTLKEDVQALKGDIKNLGERIKTLER